MKLAWLTDIHLDHASSGPGDIDAAWQLAREISKATSGMGPQGAYLIGGDIGQASNVVAHLRSLTCRLDCPCYFVLGNHDFYGGSIAGVRKAVMRFAASDAVGGHASYLSEMGVVALTDDTALIGHDGWADGGFGDVLGSRVELNDYRLIENFAGMGRGDRHSLMAALGHEAASHFRAVLPRALALFSHVIVLTHIPPFREACWHEGRISDDNWLPHFACRAAGVVLRDAMERAPDRRMTVLCGHTHSQGEVDILPNLKVITGGAVYGKPGVQRVIEVE